MRVLASSLADRVGGGARGTGGRLVTSLGGGVAGEHLSMIVTGLLTGLLTHPLTGLAKLALEIIKVTNVTSVAGPGAVNSVAGKGVRNALFESGALSSGYVARVSYRKTAPSTEGMRNAFRTRGESRTLNK
eukprot:gene23930-biopygen9723